MIINVIHPEESRVAIIEDGVLQELSIETASREKLRGNVYKAVVQKVEESLHAAFVDYGGRKPGFLPLDEVHAQYHNTKGQPAGATLPPGRILRKGQTVVVQIVKDEKGTKGAALTTYISLPGRYLVLMPGYRRTGISRKIEDAEDRKKLKELGQQLKLPESMGFIIRTAGLNKTKKELQADANYLLRLWKAIQSRTKELQAPALLYQESSMVIQAIRDYFTSDIEEVLVDDAEACRKVREFFKQIMPKYQKRVRLYEEKKPIFMQYAVEEQIGPLYRRVVPLKSGGSISIDPTEALVAIDVNSARFTRVKDPEETALITNMEAAEEVARQLRLRNLGGLIVIDFIDMRAPKNRQQLERQLKAAFKADKANIELSRVSKFGLLEMSREHLRSPLFDASHAACAYCGGTGKLRSWEMLALMVLRDAYDKASAGTVACITVGMHPDAAQYMLNQKRTELSTIERQCDIRIVIRAVELEPVDTYTMECVPRQGG